MRGRRRTTTEKLVETYRDQGIALVLGAGASFGSRLPTWDDLLKRLGGSCLGKGGVGLVREMQAYGMSFPAIASVLEANVLEANAPPDFPELVRLALYRDFKPFHAGGRIDDTAVVKSVRRKNRTLRAVAAFCVRRGRQGRFVRNPRVHGIATLNLDTILRHYIEARYGKPLLRSIERANKERSLGKTSLYYLHGSLRFDEQRGQAGKEAPDRLVLTEQQYFDFFNNPTGAFTYTFLQLLREYTCVFVGLSMKDDNIRRMLHYSRKECVQAYLDEGKTREKAEANALRHFAIMFRGNGSERLNNLLEDSLRMLGTYTVWLARPAQLPRLLKRMYTAGKGDWPAVYD